MTLAELYNAAIEVGLDADPRGREALQTQMRKLAEAYAGMPERDRRVFDRERLRNPFGDTRIVNGEPDAELRRVIIGIDIDATELLVAAQLALRGETVDAVIAHHTSSLAGGLGSRHDTAIPQVWMASEAGVPPARAHKLVSETVGRDEPTWNVRALQVARVLGIPVMCVHSPADACLYQLADTQIREQEPETVGELVELFNAWPECEWLVDGFRHGPSIDAGRADAPVGKSYLCLYGGWNPSPALFEELCIAGVGTFVMVASAQEHVRLADKYGSSIVTIPHYPADNAGINILLDRVMPEQDGFEIVECSNFVRCRRTPH